MDKLAATLLMIVIVLVIFVGVFQNGVKPAIDTKGTEVTEIINNTSVNP